jgi:hypothetical protein
MAMRQSCRPRKSATGFQDAGIAFAVFALFTLAVSLTGCATPAVSKGTGRATDPPLDLILYCLLAPSDPACRGILK